MYKILLTFLTTAFILLSSITEAKNLTGNLNRDLLYLKNCQVVDTLIANKGELKRPLTSYEKVLMKHIIPWYLQNCSKAKNSSTNYLVNNALTFINTPEEALKDYLKDFIATTCCYTNNCCWTISPKEVTDLGNDNFQINSTGQIVKRQGYSPDGEYWRCACDYDNETRTWIKHDKANTRCLYTPRLGY